MVIYNERKARYIFVGMANNSLFSCFMVVFTSYCPQFWGSRAIYLFVSYDQKVVIFAFYGRFHELLPTFMGFQGDLTWPQDTIHVWGHDQKLVIFVFYGRFHEISHIVLGFQGDLHVWELWPKTRCFRVVWPFSCSIAHSFGVPRQFTCLRVMTKHSVSSRLMAVFISYCP